MLKLLTHVNQLRLEYVLHTLWISHTGIAWGCPPLPAPSFGLRLLTLHFLLYNGPCCRVGTQGLITLITTITYHLSEMMGSSGPRGSCSKANMHCSSSSKRLCTLHSGRASQRARSVFAFRAVRKICPMVSVTFPCHLFSKRELTTCNTFSVLSREPSTAPQSSTTAQAQMITATSYHMVATGFPHPGSLRLVYLLGILPTTPIVSLIVLFLTPVVLLSEPRVGEAQPKAGRLKEPEGLQAPLSLLNAQQP